MRKLNSPTYRPLRRVLSAADSAKRLKAEKTEMPDLTEAELVAALHADRRESYATAGIKAEFNKHHYDVAEPAVAQNEAPELPRKRTIVTVSGERDAGKTTLIAILAQALRSANHKVEVPEHIPNATTAIADLHEQFDVKFVEAVPVVDQQTATDHASEIRDLNEIIETYASACQQQRDRADRAEASVVDLQVQLNNHYNSRSSIRADSLAQAHKRAAELQAEVDGLKKRVSLKTDAEAVDIINRAFTIIHDSARIAQDRDAAKRKIDEARSHYQKLSEEVHQRDKTARQMLHVVLTGTEPTASAPQAPMTASEKLNLANAVVFEDSAFQD